jgi:hypothetical protein
VFGSFHDQRLIHTATRARPFEEDEQRKDGERGDHQQFVIVNISDDLRLLRDHGIEPRSPAGRCRIPGLRDRGAIEEPIDGGDVLNDLRVVHLRVADRARSAPTTARP